MAFAHTPVMSEEVVAAMCPADGKIIVDCTVGGGGHSRAFLEACACRVIGIDRDMDAVRASQERLKPYGERFQAIHGTFSSFKGVLDGLGISEVHGVFADLGVSSHQLDTAGRGFSFRFSGPIDMRMDQSQELSAETIVNDWNEGDIADLIFENGEERHSRRVARVIVEGRPWTDTLELANAVSRATRSKHRRIHPATRTFQGIRIAVNRELDEVRDLLPAAVDRIVGGGRLAVLSFHSLEDRIVKHFMDEESGKKGEKDCYGNPVRVPRLARQMDQTPSPNESNRRARSARLRVAERLPWNKC